MKSEWDRKCIVSFFLSIWFFNNKKSKMRTNRNQKIISFKRCYMYMLVVFFFTIFCLFVYSLKDIYYSTTWQKYGGLYLQKEKHIKIREINVCVCVCFVVREYIAVWSFNWEKHKKNVPFEKKKMVFFFAFFYWPLLFVTVIKFLISFFFVLFGIWTKISLIFVYIKTQKKT